MKLSVIQTNAILKKVEALLKLAEDGCNKNQAEAAALKAQQLLSKYGLSENDVIGSSKESECVIAVAKTVKGRKWKYVLSEVVADNFRCKSVWLADRTECYFFGYRFDAEVAKQVFEFLFKVGHRMADNEVHRCYREQINTKGVYNNFVCGFITGLRASLNNQCQALSIVIPKDIEEGFNDHFDISNTVDSSTAFNSLTESYKNGFEAGFKIMDQRKLQATSV